MKLDSNQPVKDDLAGVLSLRLREGKTLDEFCARNVANFETSRFEAIAIRLYYGKDISITLYALDKARQEGENFNPDKMPVKKFKLNTVSIHEVLSFVREFNFTLTTGNYPLEDMEVVNK